MKVLFIGDIHGRDDWKRMVEVALFYNLHIVFLGDYVDSKDIRPVLILHNLKKIIELKKQYPDQVTLFLGNHDYSYYDSRTYISGFDVHMWKDYEDLFRKNIELFDIAWGYTNSNNKYTLASHAGLTLTYYNNYIKPLIDDKESLLNRVSEGAANELPIHQILNYMVNEDIIFKVGNARRGEGTPSPLWSDISELKEDNYPGINQVVGHSIIGGVSTFLKNNDCLFKVDGSFTPGVTASLLLDLE